MIEKISTTTVRIGERGGEDTLLIIPERHDTAVHNAIEAALEDMKDKGKILLDQIVKVGGGMVLSSKDRGGLLGTLSVVGLRHNQTLVFKIHNANNRNGFCDASFSLPVAEAQELQRMAWETIGDIHILFGDETR